MRNFISDLNGVIGGLASKYMTNIPEEPLPEEPPLQLWEIKQKEIKEYINAKIVANINTLESSKTYLEQSSPFWHSSLPRMKTYNEMFIEMEMLIDSLVSYADNYKAPSKPLYEQDVIRNTSVYLFQFVEPANLDVSVYNNEMYSFWDPLDVVSTKVTIDSLFVPLNNELSTFYSTLQLNGTRLHLIVNENNDYFGRLKSFIGIEKSAKLIYTGDILGDPLYQPRIPANKVRIDEIVDSYETMNDLDFALYMQNEREILKVER
jgi:hypothetical protein